MSGIDTDPLSERLRTIAQDSPDLGEAAEIYRRTLLLLRNADLHVRPSPITEDLARERMAAGAPLLRGETLEFDLRVARDLMRALVLGLEERCVTDLNPVRSALEEDRLPVSDLLRRAATGDHGYVQNVARDAGIAPGLLWTLARNTIKPALRAWCRQLTPLLHRAGGWEKGYCFICGANAVLGELQGNDQARHLRCGQCGADWPVRRQLCPHCGNEDHETLSLFYPDRRRETVRIEGCDRCGGYLKVIAAFAPTPPEQLAAEDLATLHLDYVAQRLGYERGPVR
ncbi:MAG: formate dehydrogenase accessory protein FdhE [Deltaproteobacteria bacterium]|nr:formate dehydrogenase accessory protein FdhE [Deltaproteobacteria bacterium]